MPFVVLSILLKRGGERAQGADALDAALRPAHAHQNGEQQCNEQRNDGGGDEHFDECEAAARATARMPVHCHRR